MSRPHRARTAIVAVLLGAVGVVAGAGGSAWRTRDVRTEPWRKILLDHEGRPGAATRTRIIFENPRLPLQAVEVTRSPEGLPELAHVVERDGTELTIRFGEAHRPSAIRAPDGSQALLTYKGSSARVAFVGPTGVVSGDKSLAVPVELRGALELARAEQRGALRDDEARSADLWRRLGEMLVGVARAEDAAPPISVRRGLLVDLDVRVPSGKATDAGKVDVEVSCPPFACLPASSDLPMPGKSTLRIDVTASKNKSELPKPASQAALDRFEQEAEEERVVAGRVLPDISAAIAVLGVTAHACRSLQLSGPLCIEELTRNATSAGGAVHAVDSHDVETDRALLVSRAEALYYEEQARMLLDRPTRIDLCLARVGFARACTTIDARPFAAAPAPAVPRAFDLRRGIGGALEGSYVVTQSDGADCKFSPFPKSAGPLRLTFDNERNTVTASFKATERGTRPNLRCSLGTANMSWSQSYSTTASQSFTAGELQAGGKLPLRLTGTMSGSGGYSFSNCRSSGGQSASCPGGKNEGYSYRVELLGEIDLETQTGGGRIVIYDAPLPTSGSWRVPAEKAP